MQLTTRENLILVCLVQKNGFKWDHISKILRSYKENVSDLDILDQNFCESQYHLLIDGLKDKHCINKNDELIKILTDKRQEELMILIEEETNKYLKLKHEIYMLETNQCTDDQIKVMLDEIKDHKPKSKNNAEPIIRDQDYSMSEQKESDAFESKPFVQESQTIATSESLMLSDDTLLSPEENLITKKNTSSNNKMEVLMQVGDMDDDDDDEEDLGISENILNALNKVEEDMLQEQQMKQKCFMESPLKSPLKSPLTPVIEVTSISSMNSENVFSVKVESGQSDTTEFKPIQEVGLPTVQLEDIKTNDTILTKFLSKDVSADAKPISPLKSIDVLPATTIDVYSKEPENSTMLTNQIDNVSTMPSSIVLPNSLVSASPNRKTVAPNLNDLQSQLIKRWPLKLRNVCNGLNGKTITAKKMNVKPPLLNDAHRPEMGTSEHKVWKKSIMLLHQRLCSHNWSDNFFHPITDVIAPFYSSIVHYPVDLGTLKKWVESGLVRTTNEYRRYVMIMFQNAFMYNSEDHVIYKMTQETCLDALKNIHEYLVAASNANNNNTNNNITNINNTNDLGSDPNSSAPESRTSSPNLIK